VCEVLTSPHETGQLLLLGYTQPESLIHLAALQAGYTFTQPSSHFSSSLLSNSSMFGISQHSYKLEQFRHALVHLFTIAGVKNEKMVLLLSEAELVHEEFLALVYQFVKGCAISFMFSKEEQSRVVTAVRSDLAQTGTPFSPEAAWNFFIRYNRYQLMFL